MPRPAAVRIAMRRRVRRALERITRSTRAPHARVIRAQMVLLAAAGHGNAEIARRLGCEVKTVRKWRARFAVHPVLTSLNDEKRTGRPPTIPILARLELVKLACARPPTSKAPFRNVWTAEALHVALRRTTRFDMSVTEIRRTLRDEEIRPHRMRVWLHSPDPDFAPKVRRICNVYRARPAPDEIVLCIDEKTGMQALQRKYPSKPPGVRRTGRYEFEYIRRGTRTLIAAYNPHTGEVFGRCYRRRRASELLQFMEALAKRHPGKRITVIWDNLNIHSGAAWEAFNRRHGGRFRFLYTPIHASWVNQVELWFSVLARRVLRYASFGSASELTSAIRKFIAYWNTHERRPFRWTFKGDFRRGAA